MPTKYNNDMNRMRKIVGIGLGFVLIVAIFFRFYQFPSNPPSLNWDEVAFGYNAYSILKTGKDEYGTAFPLYFRSLDDYKLPVNMYLTVGSIALFGYNDFAVRFPSAFLGVCTVLSLYFLVKGLLRYQVKTMKEREREIVSLLSAFILAILPWHIQFSRMAAEANVGLFFLTLGVTLFIYATQSLPWLLPVSIIALGFASYSYLSSRVVASIMGFVLVMLFFKKLLHINKKIIVIAGICITGIVSLLLWDISSNKVHMRVAGTSVFGTQQAIDIFKHKEQEMFYDAALKINLPRRLFHDNTYFTSADIIIRGYLTHFSPTFLFFDYDEKQHHTPFAGLFYLWMLPFMLIGWYCLFRKFQKREAFLMLLWLLLAPIPASITWDIPHAIRVYSMVIPLVITTSLGMYYSFGYVKHYKNIRLFLVGFIGVLMGISSYYYFHQYMLHLPIERSKDWVYGRKEMTEYLEKNKSKYDRIIVSSRLEWPYIFMLYYSKYDPKKYLEQGGTVSGGWAEERNKYDIYEFHKFTNEDHRSLRTLFVGKPEEFGTSPSHIINFLDGSPAIYMSEGNIKTQ